ncbi:MAG: transcriptional repressor [Pirellulales bacterium]|nr:transcriptional repressor [Pirellulales bacterium]
MRGAVEARLRQLEGLLRGRGLPLTMQRREILKAVVERNDHPTADQVFDAVKDRLPRLSRTTVYRVLDRLVTLGVIRRLHHPGAGTRFDGKIDRHHHLFCRSCGCVIDVASSAVEDVSLPPASRHGFHVEDFSVHFVGVCPDCRRKASS